MFIWDNHWFRGYSVCPRLLLHIKDESWIDGKSQQRLLFRLSSRSPPSPKPFLAPRVALTNGTLCFLKFAFVILEQRGRDGMKFVPCMAPYMLAEINNYCHVCVPGISDLLQLQKDEMQCEIQFFNLRLRARKTVTNCDVQKIWVRAMTPNLLGPLYASIKRQTHLFFIYSKSRARVRWNCLVLFDLHVPERMRALVVAASFATHSKCFYTVYAISKKSHGTRTTFGIDHYSKAQSSRQGSHHYSTINLCSLGSHLKSLKLHTAPPLSPLLIIFHLSLLIYN